ncbi:MAG: transporter related protein [Mycobacterium sp.]|nr:transporter related protein [Mycobacterium sp.]
MTAPVLAVEGLGKSYGRHRVLDGVTFDLAAGETTALLGENGAGKSTLAKILAGAVPPDAGRVLVDGNPVQLSSPRVALEHGIAFIPQELVYVPKLSVAENVCLGRWPRRAGFTSGAALRRRAAAEAERFGFDLPLERDMDTLTLAQQQMVEILKALARRSRVILLDEPTAALSSHDSERLLDVMTGLAADGVGVLYISHRLDEVFRACRTVHVLRNGRLVRSSAVGDTTPRGVIEDMLGRSADETEVPTRDRAGARPVLSVRGYERAGLPPLRDVSFEVGEGEIVGLYGVRGAGAEVIAETLGGLHPEVTGETTVDGTKVRTLRRPLAARRAGIAYVPADRKSQGLALTLPIQQSLSMLVLRTLSRLGVVARRRERATAAQLATDVQLRARGLGQLVGELSGGNQQKVLVGSRIAMRPKVLVLQEPTRGVDVGARLEIHRLLRRLADDGTATLLVTSDIEEAVNLSDRLLVVRDGAVVSEFPRPDFRSQSDVLHAAGGLD